MIDLKPVAGLPLKLNDKLRLVFAEDLPKVNPEVRTLADMREVFLDPSATPSEELYCLYRDIHRLQDEKTLTDHQIRYDIIVLRPGKVGKEYAKTAGYCHPPVPGSETAYPEVHEVLHGVAHYLLQKMDETGNRVIDVVLVEAHPGDKLIIPPDFGHTAINIGKEPLVVAKWVERGFVPVYRPMQRMRGGAYYEVLSNGENKLVVNTNYQSVAPLRRVKPHTLPAFGLAKGVPLYVSGVAHPEKLAFLVRPQDFRPLLDKIM